MNQRIENTTDDIIGPTSVYEGLIRPKANNALPNFLLLGRKAGLTWRDYHDGVLVFLHHNKAGGTSIKTCIRTMVGKRILKTPKLYKLMTFESIQHASPGDLVKYEAFGGGYSFGVCEIFEDKRCSYFTFLRHPVDRVLSAYFHCKNTRSHDQLCGPLRVGNFTIEEWAKYQGNYFFNQLLLDQDYCLENPRIRKLFEDGLNRGFIPPRTSRYIDYDKTYQCWFRQRVYLDSVLDEAARDHLIKEVINNLELWFSVIGLVEEFDLSLKMLERTYNLPFYRLCRGKVENEYKPSKDDDVLKSKLRQQLESDPEVQKALQLDIMIYEKARAIFERQKSMLRSAPQM